MKFIESTSFFVRAIVFDFVNRNSQIKLKFRFVPMVHIGSKEYYNSIYEYLDDCDEIIYEGAYIPGIKFLSNSYKEIAKKLKLETQSQAFNYNGIKMKLLHGDFDKEFGKQAWLELSFLEKLKFNLVKPLITRIQYRNATRQLLAKSFMESNEEAHLAYGPIPDEKGTAENLIIRSRENIVIKIIKNKIRHESALDKTIGIMYGAGHMKYFADFLTNKNDFVPHNGRFVKIFDV